MSLSLQFGLSERELEVWPLSSTQEHADRGLDLECSRMESCSPQTLHLLVQLLPAHRQANLYFSFSFNQCAKIGDSRHEDERCSNGIAVFGQVCVRESSSHQTHHHLLHTETHQTLSLSLSLLLPRPSL